MSDITHLTVNDPDQKFLSVDFRITRGILPAVIARADKHAQEKFFEFFAATIDNKNTRRAYMRAVYRFFDWCREQGFLDLAGIKPLIVAGYIRNLTGAKPTVKLQLAAIRMLFDHLVTSQVVPFNPASSVKGPKYSIKKGKTPILKPEEARNLLENIDTAHLVGLRDRAMIGLMIYSFARVSAAINMTVEDYYHQGRESFFNLHEKGGKYHVVPAHWKAVEYLDSYITAAGIAEDRKGSLFRASSRNRNGNELVNRHLTSNAALKIVKRRVAEAGLPDKICCHSFRGTGITAYLKNGGTIENAAAIAGHESTRTTQLYNRTSDEVSREEIYKIRI